MIRLRRRTLVAIAAAGAVIYVGALVFVLDRLHVPPIGIFGLALVAVAAIVQVGAQWLFGLLFRQGVESVGVRLRPFSAFRGALVGAGVARLIPAGGAITPVAMAWTVRQEVVGSGGAAVRATVLNYAGLLIGTGFSLLWVRGRGLYESLRAGTVTAAILAMLIGLLLMFGTRWLGTVGGKLPGWIRKRLGHTLQNQGPDAAAQGFLWARLLLEATALGLVITAFGLHLTPTQTFAAFGVSQLVGGLPGTPGGLGLTEAGLVAVLAGFGLNPEITLVPVLVFRLVSYWIPAAAGLVAGGMAFLKEAAPPVPG
jgi:uncharacterized membrane protein YbhN (UPF0104 family)